MSKKTYERAMAVCRCIDSNGCTLGTVEKKWHRCFNGVLKSFGFPKQARKRLWDELVVQVHPPEEDYVHGVSQNSRTNILHLWRPVDNDWSKLPEKVAWEGGR